MLITSILLGIIAFSSMTKRALNFLHIIQLEGYNSQGYQKWINKNKDKIYSIRGDKKETKKPLVFTSRAKRLNGVNILVNIGIISVLTIVFTFIFKDKSIYISIIGLVFLSILLFLLYLLQAYTMLLSNAIIRPIEENINKNFYNTAKSKIEGREDLKVIGITGSFGKTSTKFILGTILEEKFKVLNTPESYNTPMGLSKTINDDLKDEHEIFIAELGARKIGDIKEVAKLVSPQIGVITSIGPTHLETFKNIDNITKTKFELIEELPTDGVAIYNGDNEYIKRLSQKTFKEKVLYGIEDTEELDIFAKDIEVSKMGSSFTISNKDGDIIRCSTKLLGKHNIYNILAGVSVAKTLGLSPEEIKRGIEKIEPIPHRLNIIDPGTGIIIIDDAFNSNPIGAKAALEVMSEFREGRKIIVTPGMVELGTMEEKANREFGEIIGKECDYVILVGENRTKPIYEGLMNSNFNESNIFIVETLEGATEYIQKIAKPKDVVLFENDLPDNYS